MRSRLGWPLLLVVLGLSWLVLGSGISQEEQKARSQVRESLGELFPDLAEAARERFGVRRLSPATQAGREVLLLHGLDDPGKVWMNLAPILARNGYGVLLLDYPNDQSIRDSAAFVGRQLEQLAAQGVQEVDIVAHSMGGLVSRELLTSPGLACQPPACIRARVSRLVMVGTPNHGSDLARLRAMSEVREQLSRLFTGEAGWLDWIFDGAGEAGTDLLPNSDFLNELNARPHPESTRMWILAGVIGKGQWERLESLLSGHVGELAGPLRQASERLGDGLVSVNSARLKGVPVIRVTGNHLSIIRNVRESSERMPPAIPVILQLLGGAGGTPLRASDN